jgi:polysaccharide biosynthesis transport protein
MDIIYFFKILLRKKWIIIGLSLLSVIAAFFFLLDKKPLYKSQAQYSTGFTAEKVRLVDGSSGIDIYTADVKFNNAIETFKSPKVINTISYRLLLHDLKTPDNPYTSLSKDKKESVIYKSVNIDSSIKTLEEIISNRQLLPSNTEKEKNLGIFFKLYGYDYETMMAHLLIERVGRTDYLNINFWSHNPNLSALVVNSMGQEFLNYYKSLSSQRTKENADDIKLMVTSQQRNIDSLGKILYNEKVKQGSIDPVSLSTSAMETVKELETKLAEEKSKQNEHLNRKKYLVERLNFLQAKAVPVQNSSNNDEVMRLVNKKNDLVAELAKKGGDDAVLQKKISDLRTEINSKSSVPISKNNTDRAKELDDIKMQVSEEDALLNASNSTVADYTSRIGKYTSMANSAPVGSDVTIGGIQTKLEMENSMLSNITEKYYKAEGLIKDDPTTNFIQTAVGQPALEPESKKAIITMALAGISMLFLSSIIFLLMEIFDRRVKTPSLFKRQIKLNVANILNNVPLKKSSEQEIIANDYKGKKFTRQISFQKSIKKLRYEFLSSPNKIFLITSTQRRTGKTTIIESIASSLLLSKKSVLIVDLNFGNNTLSQKYNPAVLVEDIAGTLKYDVALKEQYNFSTSTEGLSVIGCKEGNFTPSEVLFNFDMNTFLKMLKVQFDFILIEGAALNDFADSFELATYAEEVFTVFSASAPISNIDDKSIQFIKSLGVKNSGAILNNVLLGNIDF